MGALCMCFNPSLSATFRPPSPRRTRPRPRPRPRPGSPPPPLPSPARSAAGAASASDGSRGGAVGFAVFSSHSNPRILKSNRQSPYRRRTSPHKEHDDEEEDETEDDEKEEGELDSRYSSDASISYNLPPSWVEYSDVEGFHGDQWSNPKQSSAYSSNHTRGKSVNERLLRKEQEGRRSKDKGSLQLASGSMNGKYGRTRDLCITTSRLNENSNMDVGGGDKLSDEKFTKSRFSKLKDELDFDVRWFPLIDYLSTYGLKESHFISIYERHMPCLQINVASAKERLEYLLSIGVKHRDIRKILLRQPQILEYTVKNNLKLHITFLASLGVPDSRIGQIVTAAPSLFSYSIEHSLKPTIRYLVEEVGISRTDVSKVVQLSPQILVQRLDNSWNSRLSFLSKELGASRDSMAKMVRKHPQLLHYSIEDGIQPRINFLRSIGMRNSEILKVLTSLTQVLSLSLEGNLKPKYLYLVNELRNEVQSLTKYPMYLSLSLEQRIRPRHRFLVSLKKAPKGPFPLSSLVPTDECFCQQWAGTSLEKYLAFRQALLLNNFAKKYERK